MNQQSIDAVFDERDQLRTELEQVKAERDLAILSWSSQTAEIKRLRDALKAKIDSYEYDTSFYEIQEGLEALLKEQDGAIRND